MRALALATAIFAASAISVPAQDANYDANTVLAVVNDKDITLGHMIALMERLPQQYQDLGDDQLFKGMLDQLVDQAILEDVAEAQLGDDDPRTRLMMENERRSILANHVVDNLAAKPLDEAAVQAAYDEKYGAVEPTLENNASHILVETADEALAIVAELRAGADFAQTAMDKSTGPSGPNGGELGWFAGGQMVAPFQAAVELLEVGAISEPVQTQFGWHVIKLNDRRETPPPTLELVREELETQLREVTIRAALDAHRDAAAVQRLDPKVPFAAIRDSGLLNQ